MPLASFGFSIRRQSIASNARRSRRSNATSPCKHRVGLAKSLPRENCRYDENGIADHLAAFPHVLRCCLARSFPHISRKLVDFRGL